MKLSHIVLMVAILPVATFAQTDDSQYSTHDNIKGYVGLNINYSRAQLNDKLGEYASNLAGYNVDTDDIINPDYYGFSLNAGAQFNKYFGLEGFLQKTASSTAEIDFYSAGTKIGKYKSKTSCFAFGLDALGYIPITNSKFSFIGSMGIGYYNFDGKFDGTSYVYGTSESASDDENNIAFRIGFGGQYAFSERWALRGVVRYVALNYDDDEDVVEGVVDISLGARYTF